MKTYDLLVIGFGKAGKTLAAKMSSLGKKVALVEESSSMYGGTCINIGCIPTKTLIHAAENHLTFEQAMAEKEVVTHRLNQKNKANVVNAGVDLYDAKASFVSNKVIKIVAGEDSEWLTADTIVINTGAISNRLPIPGLKESKNVFDSTGIQKLETLPQRLGIIGGGNIGLEFASLYANLGSKVTVFETANRILPREEDIVAQLAKEYMEEDGISFVLNAQINALENDEEDNVILSNHGQKMSFDAVLYATGRKPNITDLGLENTDIVVTDRGAIEVDDYCETSVPNVYAVGDVNGGLQFTYVSLDDYRIVFNKLTGQSDYNASQRNNIPTTLFIKPALARVGLTEKEAAEANLPYKANELMVSAMPRAHVNGNLRGIYKVIVNEKTQDILGATLFGEGAQENINLIKLAMDNHIPYTYIKNQIFTHPTMAENLNDVFNF